MSAVILRRRKLGRTSCREIARLSQTGIVAVRNDQPFPEGHDLVIRWGTTSNVPVRNVLNRSEAIHEVNDKAGFRIKLQQANVSVPKTLLLQSDRDFADYRNGAFDDAPRDIEYVGRPSKHAQGRKLIKGTFDECCQQVIRWGGGYVSQYIAKVKEFRVAVIQGRAVWVAEKTPGNPQDVAWNVAQGGRFDNVRFDDWPLKVVKTAIEGFNVSNLDFGGVDVMLDAEGNAYILEINSAPSLTSPYRQECFAKAFDYIVRNGKERIPLTQERGGYRKFIHPAVSDRAIVV